MEWSVLVHFLYWRVSRMKQIDAFQLTFVLKSSKSDWELHESTNERAWFFPETAQLLSLIPKVSSRGQPKWALQTQLYLTQP